MLAEIFIFFRVEAPRPLAAKFRFKVVEVIPPGPISNNKAFRVQRPHRVLPRVPAEALKPHDQRSIALPALASLLLAGKVKRDIECKRLAGKQDMREMII